MQLNAEDGGNRQCILVTNNENKICEEVTYVRNERVINGYTTPKGEHIEGLKHNTLRYYKTDLLSRDRSPRNMRALMSAATDLLCIKEDLYTEQPMFGRYKTHPKALRYFAKDDKQMLILYREEYVPEIVEEIKTIDFGKSKLKIYLFSPGRYAFEDDFFEVQDKVQLVALPAAIYDAYQKVLPTRKDQPIELATEETQEGGEQ
jgi:adenine-specific DNA-methyltransferase